MKLFKPTDRQITSEIEIERDRRGKAERGRTDDTWSVAWSVD